MTLCRLLIVIQTAVMLSAVRADKPARRIMLLDVATGDCHAIAPDTEFNRQGSPVFSPDEEYVAFDARRDIEEFSESRLLVKSLKNPKEPVKDYGRGAMPSYSKSGREIAFSLQPGRGVWVMGADGHGEFQLNPSAWHIVFSPVEEDLVAYGVRNGRGPNIVLHHIVTDETRNVLPDHVSRQYRQIYWNFQWSRDGSRIAFKGRRVDGENVLAIVETKEKDPQHLEFPVLMDHERSWFHPTNGHVYFSVEVPTRHGRDNRVFAIDLTAKRDQQMPPRDFVSQPDGFAHDVGAWTANGTRMLLVSSPRPLPADAQ